MATATLSEWNAESKSAESHSRQYPGFEKIIAHSNEMQAVFDQTMRAARTDSTVLIEGESGTGKELIAEAIHQNSQRRDEPFVPVNMAAIPETLVESELFGHVKGSFTGATVDRIGRFESANRGTLFIDEIGDFQLSSQAKLLRTLEERKVTRVGCNQSVDINVRVVAATSCDLPSMLFDKTFREDLYYRLNVLTIRLPPLRERQGDIPLLVRTFVRRFCSANHCPELTIDGSLMDFLEHFDWPGNVRQLRNCVESMVVMAQSDRLTTRDIPPHLHAAGQRARSNVRIPPGMRLEELERIAISQSLEHFGGNRRRTAEALGISIRTLQRRLKCCELEEQRRLNKPR